MRRLALAASLSLLVALVFAPAAVAKMHDDQMMGDDDMMMEDDDMMGSASAMGSASSSAMSSASATAMSSASAMDEEMMSASASASPLPRTGGMSLTPLLSAAALAMMAGSGILAARLVRRGA